MVHTHTLLGTEVVAHIGVDVLFNHIRDNVHNNQAGRNAHIMRGKPKEDGRGRFDYMMIPLGRTLK